MSDKYSLKIYFIFLIFLELLVKIFFFVNKDGVFFVLFNKIGCEVIILMKLGIF